MHTAAANSDSLALIFTIAVVISVAIQSLVFIGLFLVIAKTVRKLDGLADALSAKAHPIMDDVRVIIEDIGPKVRKVSGQVVEITEVVRQQTQQVHVTVDDVVGRTHAQAVRVDDMVSAVLGSVAHAGSTIQSGMASPARKLSGLFSALRAGLSALNSKEKRSTPASHVPVDSEDAVWPNEPMIPAVPPVDASRPTAAQVPPAPVSHLAD